MEDLPTKSISELKEYVNTECAIYKFFLDDNTIFMLAVEKTFSTGKKVISFFENLSGNILNYNKVDDDRYLLNDLIIENIDTEPENKKIINELYKYHWDGKYTFLVHDKGCNYMCMNLDSEKIYESDFLIIGVILLAKENIFSIFEDALKNKLKIFNFKLELEGGRLSSLFFEEEEEKFNIDKQEEIQEEGNFF